MGRGGENRGAMKSNRVWLHLHDILQNSTEVYKSCLRLGNEKAKKEARTGILEYLR